MKTTNRNRSKLGSLGTSKQGNMLALVAMALSLAGPLHAYQVWTSTCKTPRQAAEQLPQWAVMAKGMQGLNTNFAPGKFQPKGDQWETILKAYQTATQQTFQPWAHPENDYTDAQAAQVVGKATKRAKEMGYVVKYIMIYDHGSDGGGIDKWKPQEVEKFRAWLDKNGHKDIKIMYNARSFGSRTLLENPAIAAALNEGSVEKWLSNSAGRHELLQWFVKNPKTKDKEFFFQITVHHDFHPKFTGKPAKAFANTRLMLRAISANILKSTDWVRSDKVIFLPMSYQDYTSDFPFFPEHTGKGEAYAFSMSGLLSSLIEQRDLFEGRGPKGLITEAQCQSRSRTP